MINLNDEERDYNVFSEGEIKDFIKQVKKELASCKMSLEETIKLDDDEDRGYVSIEGLKESFEVMELNIEPKLEEFILFYIFQHSDNIQQMKYKVLIDMLDEIDEDFSPNNGVHDIEDLPDNEIEQEDPKESDDPYDDDFNEPVESNVEESKGELKAEVEINNGSQSVQPVSNTDDLINKSPDEIDEEEGLTIAENCFAKIAEKMIEKQTTVKQHYSDFIQKEVLEMDDGQEIELELMGPEGFLMGLQGLGIEELTETEVQCLMLILVKPELDNAIVVSDFEMVMENFGIGENLDPNVQITENPTADEPQQIEQDPVIEDETPEPVPAQTTQPSKKKRFDFTQLDQESLSYLYDLAKLEQDYDLKDLFKEHSYEQPIKTKNNENVVEIIESSDFFSLLEETGVISEIGPKQKTQLEAFLCLDPQYQNLVLIKKVKKACDELLSQENLIASILEWRENQPEVESEPEQAKQELQNERQKKSSSDDDNYANKFAN